MSIALLVIGIILFILLVVVHEFGHFIMARRGGVEVEEFGIFFPPRLFKRRTRGGWLFTINALPLGGFVKLKGEHDTDTEPGSIGAASHRVKTQIMAAGVVMNLLVAVAMLTILAWIGMPKLIPNQFTVKNDARPVKSSVIIEAVEEGSPADKAGLKTGDTLIKLGPSGGQQQVNQASALPKLTTTFAGQKVRVEFTRHGRQQVTEVALRTNEEVEASRKTKQPKGYLGVVPAEYKLERYAWSAPVVALGITKQVTELTFNGLGRALAGLGSLLAGAVTGNHAARQNGQVEASSQVGGPVAIFVALKEGTVLGYEFILFIIALISLTLAIMNILPIPALDGGRLWMTLIARGFKRPLSVRTEELVNGIGFLLLIGLIILITIVDVKRFF